MVILENNEDLARKFENRFNVKSRGRKSEFSAQEHADAVQKAVEAGWENMNTEERRKFVSALKFKHSNGDARIGLSTLASWIEMAKQDTPRRVARENKRFSETELLSALVTKELGDNAGSKDALIAQLGKIERQNLSPQDLDMAVGLLVAERQQARETSDLQVLLGRKIATRVLGRDFHKE